jgi:Domain of unknown function (DUF4136)
MKTLRVSFMSSLLVTTFAVASLAQSVQSDYDHTYNLAKLKTYGFYQQQRKPGDALAASPLNDRRIHDALDAQLKLNDFGNSTTEKPDFMIAYFVTTHVGLDIQDNRFGFWRGGNINVNQTTEGTIVVVFVDALTQQEIWRGLASGEVNAENLDKDVNKSIAKLVEKFVKNRAGKK